MAAPNLVECVIHWKKKLDRNPNDDDIILNVIRKLSKIHMTFEILEATHIGKSIRNLSKRNDAVGENAKTVLQKWKNIVNLESAKNSKHKSMSSDDDNKMKKYSSKQSLTHNKTLYHHEKESSHEKKEKHDKNSVYHSSSKQSFEKHKHLTVNSSYKTSESLDELNNPNFHQYMESIMFINNDSDPSSPETFSLDDNKKIPSPSDSHRISPLKRKLSTEEKVEMYQNSLPKKIKLDIHPSSDSERMKKPRIAEDKDESFSQNLEKEHRSSSHSVKQSSTSHSKKPKHDNSKVKNVTGSNVSKSNQSFDGFTSSSVSFEDCLGLNDFVAIKKKKNSKPKSSSKNVPSDSFQVKKKSTDTKVKSNPSDKKVTEKTKVSKESSHTSKEKVSSKAPKKSTMFDAPKANSPLSVMQPSSSQNETSEKSKKERFQNEDVIKFTSSRKEKTAIYSGRRSCNRSFPTLAQCCYRVLIENIDILGDMGDTPYNILKPILEKCTPNQLFSIEKYNPYLLDDTNELWEIHCKRDYKLLSPLEHETWRDVYLRGFDEREERLKHIKANISASMSKATPVRQVKLAFVDSYVKPPRDVLRRQAKSGLLESGGNVVKPSITPKVRETKKTVTVLPSSSTSSQSFVADKKDLIKTKETLQSEAPNQNPSPKRNAKPVASGSDPPVSDKDFAALSLAAKKPKVAPLMAKTLKAMKQCFRR